MIIDSLKYNGLCDCGREHIMQTKLSVIESGCLKNFDSYIKDFDLTGFSVAVYDDNTYAATADRHPSADLEIVLPSENLHANEHGVELLIERLPEKVGYLIAVGSGTIHDITRYCAYKRGIEFVSCPTAASVDGFCSSVAAMTWNGCKKTLTAVSPKLVLADIEIIKNAPIFLAKSGIGDMIGKYIALTDWRISHILTDEFLCEKIYSLTLDATDAVLKSATKIVGGDEAAFKNLMYGLLLSGLAMQMMGNSRPASGAEHHISHIIEMAPENLNIHSDALHGEKVGVGTLLALSEYKSLKDNTMPTFKDYNTFSEEEIASIFGEAMAKEIMLENSKDTAHGIRAEKMSECWADICEKLELLPSKTELLDLYNKVGMKQSLSDIGVENNLLLTLLDYSPAVRNRITLMRLRRCFE